MKAFPWLLLIAFEAITLVCWGVVAGTESVYREEFKAAGFPLWTQTVLAARSWLPAFPLPWLVYAAILSRQTPPSVGSLFTFAGTICLGVSIFLCWVVGGVLLPYFATHIVL